MHHTPGARIVALYHRAASLFGGAQATAANTTNKSARRAALERIQELELKALRALREHALGEASALDRVRAIDEQIVQLRKTLGAVDRQPAD